MVRPPTRYALTAQLNNYDGTDKLAYQDIHPLVCYAASSHPDILYLHEARKAPDWEHFHQAMLKEIRAHEQRRHWELVPRSTVPEGAVILPSVWSMRRKRLIKTGEIYKWKARLNVGGHKQCKGIDYNLTYSPVIA